MIENKVWRGMVFLVDSFEVVLINSQILSFGICVFLVMCIWLIIRGLISVFYCLFMFVCFFLDTFGEISFL